MTLLYSGMLLAAMPHGDLYEPRRADRHPAGSFRVFASLRCRDQPRTGADVDDFGPGGVDRAVPAAAKRLVQGYVIGGDRDAALQDRIVGGVGRPLGI